MASTDAWTVYILRCSDSSLYTGITNNLERRLYEHNHIQKLSAKYTWSRRPFSLIYFESADSRSAAVLREIAIKKMPRKGKLQLISTSSEDI